MNLLSPPTDYGNVASKGAVGVSEALVAPEAPGSKPVQGGGAKRRSHTGSGGWQRLCGQGNRGGRQGLAGAEWSWGRAKTDWCDACAHQYLVPLGFVGHLMELTLRGLLAYGYTVSGDLWRDTKKWFQDMKTLLWTGKCHERIRQIIFH